MKWEPIVQASSPLLTALVLYYVGMLHRYLRQLHQTVNSKMDRLLAATKAEGVLEGVTQERDRADKVRRDDSELT